MSIIVPATGPSPTPSTGITCQPWATVADVCAPCSGYGFDQALLADSLQAASDILFALSGSRYPGSCSDTVRPCARQRPTDPGRPIRQGVGGWGAYGGSGGGLAGWQPSWGWCDCNRADRTGCGSIPEVTLGAYPVTAILEVKVDGVVLDPSRYAIDDDRWLVRLADPDGTNPGWPTCQDMTLPPTAVGTWQVKLSYGTPPPPAGRRAAAVLGCELALACDPESAGKCRLPKRTQSVVRQGLTAIVLDPMSVLDKGRTGLVTVDTFLKAANPQGIIRRATAFRPDAPRVVRRRR